MRIELVVDPSKPPPLVSRVAPAAKAAAVAAAKFVFLSNLMTLPLTWCFRVGARRRRPRKNERPNKTVADLDAEMEVGDYIISLKAVFLKHVQDYTSSNAPAAA